jgi:hypothetical protein
MSAYAVAKRTPKAHRDGFCERAYRRVGPTRNVLVYHLSMRVGAKTRVFWERPQNEPCAPDIPAYAR